MKATRHRLAALVLLLPVAALCVGGVAGAGEPPLADAGLDQQVDQNATVLLDAAGSRDPDGTIRSYEWSVRTPDGRTVTPATPNAPRTTLQVRQPGRYEVTITVTDDDGQSASDTLYVDVSPRTGTSERPSSTSPSAPDTTPGLPDSTAPASDGVTDPALPDAPIPDTPSTDGPDSTSTAASDCPAGTRVEIAGCLGTVDSHPTLNLAGELYVRQGSVHTYTATVSDRPGGNERLTWTGGLGTGTTLTRAFPEPPGSTVTVSATVHDGEGHTTTESIVVHVVAENAPPEVRIEGPVAACVGEPVELEGYAVASESNDRITDVTWHGDPTFVPQHPGQYQVGFSARDRQGQTARTSHTVTVRAKAICEPDKRKDFGRTGVDDKLVIRAADDNWVEGSGVSSVMRARGKVPDSGPVEKLSDIGAAAGKFGEATREFATGNEETRTFRMSAQKARRLSQKVSSRQSDSVVAGANGPRVNEHERLKDARVVDDVEATTGQVVVVVRIGQDNQAKPDVYQGASPPETEGEQNEQAAGSPSKTELASVEEQTRTLESQGPVEAARQLGDTVMGVVRQAPVSVSPPAPSDTESGTRVAVPTPDSSRSEPSGSDTRTQRLRDRMPTLATDSSSDEGRADAGENAPLRGRVDTAIP